MYIIVRIVISCISLFFSVAIIKKSKRMRKKMLYILSICASLVLFGALTFLPFENLFINFNSPNSAYEYYSCGKSNIELVVEGSHCDYVLDSKSNSNKCLIVPKTDNGWKIGIGLNTKRKIQKFSNGIVVYVYQYKNTNDYFITIFDIKGGELEISDDYDTKFYSLEKKNDFSEKTSVTYHAHFSDFNSQYSVVVNGYKILLEG